MLDRMPQPGTFLHPMGRCYCGEVLSVHERFYGADHTPGLPQVQFRRWGWRDGAPYNDGHREHFGVSLRPRGPGVWTSPAWYPHRDLYGLEIWRVVSRPRPDGQLEMFA